MYNLNVATQRLSNFSTLSVRLNKNRSARRTEYTNAADVAGLVSITSFLALEKLYKHGNSRIDSVVRADWIALACQVGAMLLG
jgi:hypothetical protein